jgi:hypothetical protein
VVLNVTDKIIDDMGKRMAEEIDRQILWGMLSEIGWTWITLDRLQDNKHAIDITYWLEENCKGECKREGREFLFEFEKDASMFILKWV